MYRVGFLGGFKLLSQLCSLQTDEEKNNVPTSGFNTHDVVLYAYLVNKNDHRIRVLVYVNTPVVFDIRVCCKERFMSYATN